MHFRFDNISQPEVTLPFNLFESPKRGARNPEGSISQKRGRFWKCAPLVLKLILSL